MFMSGGYLLILITNSFVPLPLLGFLFSLYTTILRCASCIELLSAVFTSMPDSLATPELYMDVLSCNIYISIRIACRPTKPYIHKHTSHHICGHIYMMNNHQHHMCVIHPYGHTYTVQHSALWCISYGYGANVMYILSVCRNSFKIVSIKYARAFDCFIYLLQKNEQQENQFQAQFYSFALFFICTNANADSW